jgi:hypothetical protein
MRDRLEFKSRAPLVARPFAPKVWHAIQFVKTILPNLKWGRTLPGLYFCYFLDELFA